MSAKKSVATMLVDLAQGAGMQSFHTADGESHAVVPTESHAEVWPVRSSGFRTWLRRLYYQTHRGTAGSQAVEDALGTLEGMALFDGATEAVHVRLAEHNGAIYLDLADPYWRVVEITAHGWRVIDRSPVRFIRPKHVERLPEPVHGGALDGLRNFLTIDDDGWRLMAAWEVATMRPGRPFPILALFGEPGTAKTTVAKILRRLVDQNTADLRPCPREEYDLALAAKNGWIVAFDNVSEIKPWLSDALCRVATGIGFGRRKLYSDGEEHIFAVRRPIIVNGIEEVAVRGDFNERAIVQGLQVIPEESRRSEAELLGAFETARPALLGGLLDVVVGALARLPDVALARPPRMADFAIWATAAESGLGWEAGSFMRAYRANQRARSAATLEASLVMPPLRLVLDTAPAGMIGRPPRAVEHVYAGRVSELLRALRAEVDDRILKHPDWPKDATRLAGELRRIAPALRQGGIGIEFPRRKKTARSVSLWLTPAATRKDESGETASSASPGTNGAGPGAAGDAGDAGDADSGSFSFRDFNGTDREPGDDDDDPTIPCSDCGAPAIGGGCGTNGETWCRGCWGERIA